MSTTIPLERPLSTIWTLNHAMVSYLRFRGAGGGDGPTCVRPRVQLSCPLLCLLRSPLSTHSHSMFSRVASTVARAPARVAARRFTSRAAAAVAAQGSSSASTFAAAAAGACAVAGLALAVQPDSALCAAPAFKYTGEPGTVHERSFIVSFGAGRAVESLSLAAACRKRLICFVL